MTHKARVLLVEDDIAISTALAAALERDGYQVETRYDGAGALESLPNRPDVILLDLGLPDMDGLEVCRRIRHKDVSVPILMLTARCDEIDVVVGLDAGADDYVTKPFRIGELMARLRALQRRPRPAPSEADPNLLRVDESGDVHLRGRPLGMPRSESAILRTLIRNEGRVVSREQLVHVSADGWPGSSKSIDMHISQIRRRLAIDEAASRIIHTVRGYGYRLDL
ncbi:response regulator transcription factor [Luteipulveratus mongoliensis]|uniref:response regulator transcription factor n=1 Tax=Luteipulveratus mongoliensis TaxID=571913 RepID=UPI001FE1F102|nr:response regulator transcription factor [Luteipulveratus mongoliensis]